MIRSSLHIATLLIIGFVISACEKESPFLTKEEAETEIEAIRRSRDPFYEMGNVAAIINNDIYYFENLDSVPKRLTNSPSSAKTDVKLSHDKSRIAYLNNLGRPVIISTETGQIIQTLTQYSSVTQMDWAKDRLTLYMLYNQDVVFYGSAISVIQPDAPHPYDEVFSFSMNAKGDQGYFIHRYNTTGRVLKYHSTEKNLDKDYYNIDGDQFDYIDFYDNTGNFLLGYKANSWSDEIDRIACLQEYNFWPVYEWSENMYSPEFNATNEVLLFGTVDGGYFIKAVYLGQEAYESTGSYDILSKKFDKYKSTTPIYLDWVHE